MIVHSYNVLQQRLRIFGYEIFEFSLRGGAGEVDCYDFVLGGIFVGEEVLFRAVVGDSRLTSAIGEAV